MEDYVFTVGFALTSRPGGGARTHQQDAASWGWSQPLHHSPAPLPAPSSYFFLKGETLCLNEAGIRLHKTSKDGLKSSYFRKLSFWLNVKPI